MSLYPPMFARIATARTAPARVGPSARSLTQTPSALALVLGPALAGNRPRGDLLRATGGSGL
jgi:hypothetical protein